jgi:3-dehydroquinate dehydratase / shikimate dehydrogenase
MGRKPTLPRICIAATGRTSAELMARARRALDESRFVELRLDWVANPADAIARIPELLAAAGRTTSTRKPILQATCRRRENGGKFSGSVGRQIELLRQAAEAGCAVVDLEIESAESVGAETLASLRRAARLILSFHDFQTTPPLAPVARRLRRFAADYYKIVPTATRQSANCAVLDFLASISEDTSEAGRWVAFTMGEAGVPSRVLALSRGSAFVYAAPSPDRGAATATDSMLAAPGLLDGNTLRTQYRAGRLNQSTAIYGLVGNPVRHSIGAAIHNASFHARGIDAVYLPLLANDLKDFRRTAERYPLAGFSITIPHKRGILRFVYKRDRWVAAAGAVNTIRIRGGRWEAINTDVDGIRVPLQLTYRLSQGQRLQKDFRAVIVGNGGSARAAFIALRSLGCRDVAIAGRNLARARRLAKEMRGEAITLNALRRERFNLLIHATPVGMWPHENECLLPTNYLRADTVFDLIYNPHTTELLKRAHAAGCRTISGLEMFLAQAARQFEFWTGKKPPISRMRRVAVEALNQLGNARPGANANVRKSVRRK